MVLFQTIPPLTRMVWPLIYAQSDEHSVATISAMSSGWPRRPSGNRAENCCFCSSGLSAPKRSVSVGPGATVFAFVSTNNVTFNC